MNELKICSKCYQAKSSLIDFYSCQGKMRSECKACTIKRNLKYQKKIKAWRHRYLDEDDRREYMRSYYHKNKEKFAQYRSEFKEKYPDYYKEYFRKKKNSG